MDRNNSNDRTIAGVIAATAIIATIALLALTGLGGVSCAAEGENAGGSEGEIAGAAVSAASVTDSINYQGRLTDSSGSPLSGTYTMTFGLYDVSTGGTTRATDTHVVEFADGLFNTGIDFDRSYFDGRALWLGVTVGKDDEMTPRQELRPVPYALSLVPGARIDGSVSGPALKINNTETGEGVHGVYGETSGNWGWASGVYGKATKDYAIGVTGRNTGGGAGVYGWSDEGPGVIGTSDNDTGMYGIGKYGGYFTTNQAGTSGNNNAGVNVSTAYDYSDGVCASTTGNYSAGVYTSTTGDRSRGVSASTSGDGSYGVRVSTYGDDSDGVYAYTTGDNSDAVYAYSAKGYGVYGEGKYGGYFTTNQGGSWGDHNAGVNVSTAHKYSDGVQASTSGDGSDGVVAETYGDYSDGVYAFTAGASSPGVRVDTTGDNSHGVLAETTGYHSDAVYAYSDKSFGVFGVSNSLDCAGVYAKGKGDGADLILGGSDGKIQSTPTDIHSNIYLIANRNIKIHLDNDGTGEDADFSVYDKDDDCIFRIDESGDVTYGGPNIAAFPRPAYDSGWVSIGHGVKTLTHDLGGNPDNYVVDMQFYSSSYGRHQLSYGGDHRSATIIYGAYWRELDDTRIKVRRYDDDATTENIRVRIWVYK